MTILELLFDAQLKYFMEDILDLARKQPKGKEYKIYVVANGFKRTDIVDMLISVETGIPYSDMQKALNSGGLSQLGGEIVERYTKAADKLSKKSGIAISEKMSSLEELSEIKDDAYIIFVLNYPNYFVEDLVSVNK